MKFRFIVIDDAAFIREILKDIVQSSGGKFIGEAGQGDEAISLFQATLPDVVFLDLVMPQKNGIEIAKFIRELDSTVKIIGCSTVDQQNLIEQAYRAGFDAYVTKPFTKENITNAILEVLPHLGESIHGRT